MITEEDQRAIEAAKEASRQRGTESALLRQQAGLAPNWERTGRSRYIKLNLSVDDAYGVLAKQIEETAFTVVGEVSGWETRWRFAKPEDLPGETVVGLSDT